MFVSGRDRQARGRLGEALAAWFLRRRGYRVVARNERLGRFEIDLVVERGGTLIFVEVKWRGAASWGGAPGALRPAQRARLAAAAEAYAVQRRGRSAAVRFDVVTVEESAERLVLEHWQDAFGVAGELR